MCYVIQTRPVISRKFGKYLPSTVLSTLALVLTRARAHTHTYTDTRRIKNTVLVNPLAAQHVRTTISRWQKASPSSIHSHNLFSDSAQEA